MASAPCVCVCGLTRKKVEKAVSRDVRRIKLRRVAIILKSRVQNSAMARNCDQRMANLTARNQMQALLTILLKIKLLFDEAFDILKRNKNPPDKQHARTFQNASRRK